MSASFGRGTRTTSSSSRTGASSWSRTGWAGTPPAKSRAKWPCASSRARSHPYSNVITRCVGANSDVMPDVYLGTVKPGDLFLLASDGLTGMLDDSQLAELLGDKRMPEEQVDELIGEANRHGGLDNITAILVRVDAVDGPGRGSGGSDGGQATTQPGGRSR